MAVLIFFTKFDPLYKTHFYNMFGLDALHTFMLILLLLAAVVFEFINGFHDTANAVATVIYTKSLKPKTAVIWSGFWNFVGVYVGGIAVAMGIMHLIPNEMLADHNTYRAMALIWAIIITAIGWNFFTWYFGIPCSSSHTLIGSIFGVAYTYTLLHPEKNILLNWHKIMDIGLALFISPVVGFVLALLLMYVLFKVVKKKKIFKKPNPEKKPPFWIRIILILTSTSVSFSHGSNDGQKGVGIVMIILIALAPSFFALDNLKDPHDLAINMQRVEVVLNKVDITKMKAADQDAIKASMAKLDTMAKQFGVVNSFSQLNGNMVADSRMDIMAIVKNIKGIKESNLSLFTAVLDKQDLKRFDQDLDKINKHAEYAPTWVILLISIALGLGTMIGWKRIVVTISEKIGKTQMTYAQGATSGVIAASTIGLSSAFGLPVSTTHILSSGIAGSMVASGGLKNLQTKTLKNIGVAWLVTLPVTILVSGLLYWLFIYLIG